MMEMPRQYITTALTHNHALKGVTNTAVTMFNRVSMLTEKIQASLMISI